MLKKCRRFMNEFGERELAESKVMRRLAQLTIYQWTRATEWMTKQSEGICTFFKAGNAREAYTCTVDIDVNSNVPAVRFTKRFIKNLQDEVKKLK